MKIPDVRVCVDKACELMESNLDDLHVFVFPQTWSSTALGFGGVGGQVMTTAYTIAVLDMYRCNACVFFDGTLAYQVPRFDTVFLNDVHGLSVRPVSQAYRYSR